jgi:hypothetical protein
MNVRDPATLLIAAMLMCCTAHAVPFTYRSSGIIAAGEDGLGLFGGAGKNISNFKFALTTHFDTSDTERTDVSQNYVHAHGISDLTFSLTVSGMNYSSTIAYDPTTDDGYSVDNDAGIYNYVSANGPNSQLSDQAYVMISGTSGEKYQAHITQLIYSYYNSFIGMTPDFETNFIYTSKPRDTFITDFGIWNGTEYTYFSAYTGIVEINPPNASIPEPNVFSLFLVGLIFLSPKLLGRPAVRLAIKHF